MTFPSIREGRSGGRWLLAVALVTALAAALRWYQLGVESLWVDELIMLRVTELNTPTLLRELYTTARAPLYPLLAHFWQMAFGDSQAALRALSALFGTLSVPLVALIGRELFDGRTGLVAALFMALSPFQLYFSQEYRYYSLAILLTLASMWFFIRALETGRGGAFALYALFTALHVYAHPLSGALFGAAMGLYLLVRWTETRRRLRGWIGAHLLIIALAAPTVVLRLMRSTQGSVDSPYFGSGGLTPDWLTRPPIYEPVRTLTHFLLLGTTRYLTLIPAAAVILLFVVGLVVFIRRRGWQPWLAELRGAPRQLADAPRDWRESALLLVFWLAGPMAISYVISFAVLPVYQERYLSLSAPALYLLLAALSLELRRILPQTLSVGLLAALMAIAAQQYYVRDVKEQWDEMAAYVETRAQPGDALAFSSDTPHIPARATGHRHSFNHYYQGALPQCELDVMAGNAEVFRELQACADTSGKVWLLVRYSVHDRVTELGEYIAGQEPDAGGLLEMREFVGYISLYLLDVS